MVHIVLPLHCYKKKTLMWKIFKTALKITITVWLIKSIWNDIGQEDVDKLKSVFKQIN